MTDVIARATHAEQIINDPLVVETLDAIEQKWIEAIMASSVDDAETRELAYRMYKAVQQFRDAFNFYIANGKFDAAMMKKGTP